MYNYFVHDLSIQPYNCVFIYVCIFLSISLFLKLSLYTITFWVSCCHVLYDFCIQTMFGSSLHSVVCRTLNYVIYVCLHIVVSNTFCVVFCFVFRHLCCFSSSMLFFVILCTLCCLFLWIVHFWFALRYSLTFM